MAAFNSVISYAAGATGEQILDALMADLLANGFTLLEDNNADDASVGVQFFTVQNQLPANSDSRMILEFRFDTISGDDYVAAVVWEGPWTVSVPSTTKGEGVQSVFVTDAAEGPTSGATTRFHRVTDGAVVNGGTFYLDGDDATGLYLAIHSERGTPIPNEGTRNFTGHYICVCGIQRSGNPNYGVLCFANGNSALRLRARFDTDHFGWIPPTDHDGNLDDQTGGFRGVDGNGSASAYYATVPMNDGASGDRPGGMKENLDEYTGKVFLLPIFIGNNRSANSTNILAVGYRGVAQGIKYYGQHSPNLPWRTLITDDSAQQWYVYAGEPPTPADFDRQMYLAVPAA